MALPTVTITGKILLPDGSAPARGYVTAHLSASGSVVDAATGQTDMVAEQITASLTSGTGEIALPLVPNSAIVPSGTHYRVEITLYDSNNRPHHAPPEKWQIASGTATIDVGAVLRIGGTPLLVYGPDPATLAARDAAVASAATASAAAASLAIDGGAPSSTYGGMAAYDGGTP